MTPTTSDGAGIAGMLAKDEAYDRDPQGDPPVTVARYRQALRAALAVGMAVIADQPPVWEGREADAYVAGRRDALLEVSRRVALALGVSDVDR